MAIKYICFYAIFTILSIKLIYSKHHCEWRYIINIAKGTTDPRVEFCFPKFKQVQTQILIKFHPQNLEQVSTSKSQPNMNIWTKVKLQNIDQT